MTDLATVDPGGAPPDGRHQRRARNRAAVVDAILSLFREGNLETSPAEIAERAGVSERSVFRYFDDLDDLRREAIATQLASVEHLREVRAAASDPLHERIAALVDQRITMYDAVGWVGVLTRMRAPVQPLVAAELDAMRASFHRQVAELFAPELTAIDETGPRAARNVLAAADVLCSFESYQLLRYDQHLGQQAAREVLEGALAALFDHARQPSRQEPS